MAFASQESRVRSSCHHFCVLLGPSVPYAWGNTLFFPNLVSTLYRSRHRTNGAEMRRGVPYVGGCGGSQLPRTARQSKFPATTASSFRRSSPKSLRKYLERTPSGPKQSKPLYISASETARNTTLYARKLCPKLSKQQEASLRRDTILRCVSRQTVLQICVRPRPPRAALLVGPSAETASR